MECSVHDLGELTAGGNNWSVTILVSGPPWTEPEATLHETIASMEEHDHEVPSWLQLALPHLRMLRQESDPEVEEWAARWALCGVDEAEGAQFEQDGLGPADVIRLRAALDNDQVPMPKSLEVPWLKALRDDPALRASDVAEWRRAGVQAPDERPTGLVPEEVFRLRLAGVPQEEAWGGIAKTLCPNVIKAVHQAGRSPDDATSLARVYQLRSWLESGDSCLHDIGSQSEWACGWSMEDSAELVRVMEMGGDLNWPELSDVLTAGVSTTEATKMLRGSEGAAGDSDAVASRFDHLLSLERTMPPEDQGHWE
jgi:hypothetical protein